jgi:hypothetical protein
MNESRRSVDFYPDKQSSLCRDLQLGCRMFVVRKQRLFELLKFCLRSNAVVFESTDVCILTAGIDTANK